VGDVAEDSDVYAASIFRVYGSIYTIFCFEKERGYGDAFLGP
jgi:hypothetical protein